MADPPQAVQQRPGGAAGEAEGRGRAEGQEVRPVQGHGWQEELQVGGPLLPGRGDVPFALARSAAWVPTEAEAWLEHRMEQGGHFVHVEPEVSTDEEEEDKTTGVHFRSQLKPKKVAKRGGASLAMPAHGQERGMIGVRRAGGESPQERETRLLAARQRRATPQWQRSIQDFLPTAAVKRQREE